MILHPDERTQNQRLIQKIPANQWWVVTICLGLPQMSRSITFHVKNIPNYLCIPCDTSIKNSVNFVAIKQGCSTLISGWFLHVCSRVGSLDIALCSKSSVARYQCHEKHARETLHPRHEECKAIRKTLPPNSDSVTTRRPRTLRRTRLYRYKFDSGGL